MPTVEELEEQIKKLRAKKSKLVARERSEKEKKRTHHLCVIAGLVEQYCGEITDVVAFEDYLKKYGYAIKKTQPQEEETTTEDSATDVNEEDQSIDEIKKED